MQWVTDTQSRSARVKRCVYVYIRTSIALVASLRFASNAADFCFARSFCFRSASASAFRTACTFNAASLFAACVCFSLISASFSSHRFRRPNLPWCRAACAGAGGKLYNTEKAAQQLSNINRISAPCIMYAVCQEKFEGET